MELLSVKSRNLIACFAVRNSPILDRVPYALAWTGNFKSTANKCTFTSEKEQDRKTEKNEKKIIRTIHYNGTEVNISKASGNHENVSSCQSLTITRTYMRTTIRMQSHKFHTQKFCKLPILHFHS